MKKIRPSIHRWSILFLLLGILPGLACRTLQGSPAPSATPRPPAAARTAAPLLSPAPTSPTPKETQTTQQPAVSEMPPAPSAGEQMQAILPSAHAEVGELGELNAYSIQVEIDFENLSFAGRMRLDYINAEEDPLQQLYFRLFPNGGKSYGDGSLDVTSVSVDGERAATDLSLSSSVLEVTLPAPLLPGDRLAVEMSFEGEVPENYGDEGYGIYNYTSNVMALSGWFPLLAVYDDEGWNLDPVSALGDSVYADMAFYNVDVRLDSDIVLVATGIETAAQEVDNQVTRSYITGPVRDFFMILSPEFQAASGTQDGVRVNSYTLPGDAAGGEAALEIARQSLSIFNDKFGPYPYTELDIVQTPLIYAAGVEFPAVVIILDEMYSRPRSDDFIDVIAHEVAHQWWYNLVGNDVIDDPWLDEALATYAAAVYFEEVDGPGSYSSIIQSFQDAYRWAVDSGEDDLVTAGMEHFEGGRAGDYGLVVYLKGALFFHEVREATGDESFFAGLQIYFRENKYGIGEPQELLDSFEAAAGQELDDLYQEWLYSSQP